MSSGNMPTCANCGNEVRESARFCGSCGAPVAPPDELPSPVEPPPVASSSGKRRLHWVAVAAAAALLVVGGAVAAIALTGDDEPSQAELTEIVDDLLSDTTETDPFGDTSDPTDIFGDTTDTTDATETTGAIGQGVDETCEDLVAFFALAKEVDIARGGDSVDEVEQLAEAASELASKAPEEPETGSFVVDAGEPRESLERIAEDYGTYVSVLSELGLEPGPDALLEPRISGALEDVGIQVSLGLAPWIDARCSEEHKALLTELGSG